MGISIRVWILLLAGVCCAEAAVSQAGGQGTEPRAGRKARARDRSETLGIKNALRWLVTHQAKDGYWDADGFAARDQGEGPRSTGRGAADADILVTALALYAILSEGSSRMRSSPHARKAVHWLRRQQRPSGAIGDEESTKFVHGHALATMALAHAHLRWRNGIDSSVVRAVACLNRFRHPKGGWSSTPGFDGKSGSADPSLTLWCALAYRMAVDAKVPGADQGLAHAKLWVEGLLDAREGVRPRPIDHGPLGTPAMKADPGVKHAEFVASVLLGRYFTGGNPYAAAGGRRSAQTLAARPPKWRPGEMSHVEWYAANRVMFQGEDKAWNEWAPHILREVVQRQAQRGPAKGSWDPEGVWGRVGGRVYSTAMMMITLTARDQPVGR